MQEYVNSPYLWSLLFSIAGFMATEFFFPIDSDDPLSKKQKHFWSIVIFLIIALQGFVISLSFETSKKLDAHRNALSAEVRNYKNEISGSVKNHQEVITNHVADSTRRNTTHFKNIADLLSDFNRKIGTVTGYEDVTSGRETRILINKNLQDTIVIYDRSSNKFPELIQKEGERFWVRLSNDKLIEHPVVELRISPAYSEGKEPNTPYAFGVSANTLKLLSGNNDAEQLKVKAKVIKH